MIVYVICNVMIIFSNSKWILQSQGKNVLLKWKPPKTSTSVIQRDNRSELRFLNKKTHHWALIEHNSFI